MISISKTYRFIPIILIGILLIFSTINIQAEETSQDPAGANNCANANNTSKTCNNKSIFPFKGNQLIYIALVLIIVVIASIIGISYGMKRQFLKHQEALLPKDNRQNKMITSNGDLDAPPYKQVMTKMLSDDENRIINELINQKGSALQSQISRLPDMGKVKAHRILKELKKKEIVNITANGKTNEISLKDDIKDMILTWTKDSASFFIGKNFSVMIEWSMVLYGKNREKIESWK